MKDLEVHTNCPQSNLIQPTEHQEQSSIRMNTQSNAQGSTKSLHRSYSIERMDSDTDLVVANLNLEERINNYNT